MFAQPRIKLLDILCRVGEKIRQIHFAGLRAAESLHSQLYPVLVVLDARLHLDYVIAIEENREVLHVIPETRLNRSASIAQLQPQKRLGFTGRA